MGIISYSESETEQVGRSLGQSLAPPAVVALYGDMGAGKTAFVRGLCEALGVAGPVTSPTYSIVNEYEGAAARVFHFDLYRLSGPDELFGIGWEDYLSRGGICIIEWSERAEALLNGAVRVELRKFDNEPELREIIITGGHTYADTGC